MCPRIPKRRHRSTPCLLTLAVLFWTAPCVVGQEQSQVSQPQKEGREDEQPSLQVPRDRQAAIVTDERADDGTLELGVLVCSCPGNAVCIRGTLPDGPACQVGIEAGDYILTLNGRQVVSPASLKELIEIALPHEEVTLQIWRQGETLERKVQLASKADQLPQGRMPGWESCWQVAKRVP